MSATSKTESLFYCCSGQQPLWLNHYFIVVQVSNLCDWIIILLCSWSETFVTESLFYCVCGQQRLWLNHYFIVFVVSNLWDWIIILLCSWSATSETESLFYCVCGHLPLWLHHCFIVFQVEPSAPSGKVVTAAGFPGSAVWEFTWTTPTVRDSLTSPCCTTPSTT